LRCASAVIVSCFPGPDRSLRLEDLQAGRAVSRRYRNRRIGEFLKELDLTAYSTETGHSVHGKLDSRSVATRGLFFTPDLRV